MATYKITNDGQLFRFEGFTKIGAVLMDEFTKVGTFEVKREELKAMHDISETDYNFIYGLYQQCINENGGLEVSPEKEIYLDAIEAGIRAILAKVEANEVSQV